MKESNATIIHINVIEFYASIAVAKERSLHEKAFVIAQDETHKATILSPSIYARKEGIERGMNVASAKHLVPNLLVIALEEIEYLKAQKVMYEIACEYTPTIENRDKGHLYLNMSGTSRLFGPPVDSAVHIARDISQKLSISPAIAIATNRLVAKIATRAIRPYGITHVPLGEERDFLSVQDISFLPGLSPSTTHLLRGAGMKDIGSIALLDDEEAIALLGKDGINLRSWARGEDNNGFENPFSQERNIETHVDFAHSTHTITTLKAGLIQAMVELGGKLRVASLGTCRIEMALYWVDKKISYATITSKKLLIWESDLIALIDPLIEKALNRRLEMIGVDVRASLLSQYIVEGTLFEKDSLEKTIRIQHSIDSLRARFGNHAIL
ncbi:MAG: DNA polymerase, partial [Spirochaetia bacterium]|nr:DNA polymerase [Spirochaetia bacterium]